MRISNTCQTVSHIPQHSALHETLFCRTPSNQAYPGRLVTGATATTWKDVWSGKAAVNNGSLDPEIGCHLALPKKEWKVSHPRA